MPQDLPSEPQWKELSKSGRFEWHDHRMHWMGEGDPPELTDKSKETVIYDNWQIPIEVGGTKGEVTGTLTWVPLDSGGLPIGAIFGFAALIIVLSIAVFIVRRRRGEPSEGQGDRRGVVRRAVALLLALVAGLVAPASAFAHATLQSTIPERGAKLDAPPEEVVFVFDEAVEASFGALRVFDATGSEVQIGEPYHPEQPPGTDRDQAQGRPRRRHLHGDLSRRVRRRPRDLQRLRLHRRQGRDADRVARPAARLRRRRRPGHEHRALGRPRRPVRGDRPRPRRADLLPRLLAARAASSRGPSPRGWSGILLFAAIAGLVSALLAVILQGAIGQGATFWSAARPDTFVEVLGTRFGRAWGIAAGAWLVVLAVLATRPLRERERRPVAHRTRPTPLTPPGDGGGVATGEAPSAPAPSPAAAALSTGKVAALAVPLFALALLPSLGGHTSVQKPVALLHARERPPRAGDGRVARRDRRARVRAARRHGGRRARAAHAAARRPSSGGSRRSPGPRCVLLILTGVVQSLIEVAAGARCWTRRSAAAVLIKIGVAVAILALGAYNRQQLVPALKRLTGSPGQTGVLLRRILRRRARARRDRARRDRRPLELRAVHRAGHRQPFSTTVNVGPARVEVTVDPARVGPNETHVYLFDRETGAPLRGHQGAAPHRRDAVEEHRQDRRWSRTSPARGTTS